MAFERSQQKEDFLLNLRGEVQEAHDLSHPGAGNVVEPGDFLSLGVQEFFAQRRRVAQAWSDLLINTTSLIPSSTISATPTAPAKAGMSSERWWG